MTRKNKLIKDLTKEEIAEFLRDLTPIARKFTEEYKEWDKRMEILLPQLSKTGWTISPSWSLPQIEWLSTELDSTTSIDDYLLEYYTENDSEELKALFNRIANNPKYSSLDNWRILLKDCISIYPNYFRPIIPCLFLVTEGLLSEIMTNPNGIRVINPSREQVDKQKTNIMKLAWISISEFVAEIFHKHNFTDDRRSLINRHRILHGRDDCLEWKEIDAIRLFNTIECIAWVLSKSGNE